MHCRDSPTYILDQSFCLSPLSKKTPQEDPGKLRLVLHDEETCDGCRTLKTVHQLELRLESGGDDRCDAGPARVLDGRLYVCDLTHALANADFFERGFHGGNFTWVGQKVLAIGTLSGITNAGTHHAPVFEPCQVCNEPRFMEGRFCGVIRRSADPALLGCQLFGTYRLRFDDSLRDQETPIRGVLEGLIVCECEPAEAPVQ